MVASITSDHRWIALKGTCDSISKALPRGTMTNEQKKKPTAGFRITVAHPPCRHIENPMSRPDHRLRSRPDRGSSDQQHLCSTSRRSANEKTKTRFSNRRRRAPNDHEECARGFPHNSRL